MYHFRSVSFTLIRMPKALPSILNASCGASFLQHMLCDIHINLSALQYQSTAGRVKDRLLALTFIFLLLLPCVMDKGDLQGRRGTKKKRSACVPFASLGCTKRFERLFVQFLAFFFFFFLSEIPDPHFSGFPRRHSRKLESSWD